MSNLEEVSRRSLYTAGPAPAMIDYTYRVFARFLRPGAAVLELGPAEGLLTRHLAGIAGELTVVDGSRTFCDQLAAKFPQARVVHSLFETFAPAQSFDAIVLGHVLEHVEDPVAILRLVGRWLGSGGRVLAAVPNARSLHRQAAVIMGLLPHEHAQSELDRHHGHRRIFDPESFRHAFTAAGLCIETYGGYWLKPVSNQQLEAHWDAAMLDAFMHLGERYPDIAAEIYVVAGKHA